MTSSTTMPVLIIGLGNPYRGDDGAGLETARQLRGAGLAGVTILERPGDPVGLIEAWKNAQSVILIDAVQSGAEPGSICRFDARAQPIPVQLFSASSHLISLAEVIELARSLNQLPPQLLIYGIEGKEFGPGENLTPSTKQAIQKLIPLIRQEIEKG